jgi:hypothetical protein
MQRPALTSFLVRLTQPLGKGDRIRRMGRNNSVTYIEDVRVSVTLSQNRIERSVQSENQSRFTSANNSQSIICGFPNSSAVVRGGQAIRRVDFLLRPAVRGGGVS